jgi:hypothetical protein
MSVLLCVATVFDADGLANADPSDPGVGPPNPVNPIVPPGGNSRFYNRNDDQGIGGYEGFNGYQSPFAPGGIGVFLCPGRGGDAVVLGIGGGYCDYDFIRAPTGGNMHIHCEWGGFAPIITMWNCWRVFPGQPDHPSLPDPDIIPDGMGVPYALTGPTPEDQWPPRGLAPVGEVGPPPPALPPEQAPPPNP